VTTGPVVPIRALQHHAYCPRLAALVHVDHVWADSEHTLRGVQGHARVDRASARTERGRRVLRGIPLWSERLGLTGRADAVELRDDGTYEPVEYKQGARHGRSAEIQVCAQALCIEEMLATTVTHAGVWYAAIRRRHRVPLEAELRALTERTVRDVRAAMLAPRLPAPPNDRRCQECQLRGHCLPGVVADPAAVGRYIAEEVFSCE
jgi:CRISPR-associated exonuclease Cas4